MKRWATVAFILVLGASLEAQPNTTLAGAEFVFLGKQDAGRVLQTSDSFFRSLSTFDIAARSQSPQVTTLEAFGRFVQDQALDWTPQEVAKTKAILGDIRAQFASTLPLFPSRIQLVKTNGSEEGHAAYCRGGDTIVLPTDDLGRSTRSLEHTITHELFHILSRNNPALKESLYQLIGFHQAKPLVLPASLTSLKITNPDAHEQNHYFVARVAGNVTATVVPVLLASAPYGYASHKDFFEYLELHFFAVTVGADGTMTLQTKAGNPVGYPVEELLNFGDAVGHNTDYILDPEEILADNFMLMVLGPASEVKTPQLQAALAKALGVAASR